MIKSYSWNELIDCYHSIYDIGHHKDYKKSSGILLWGGCWETPLGSRPSTLVLRFLSVLRRAFCRSLVVAKICPVSFQAA